MVSPKRGDLEKGPLRLSSVVYLSLPLCEQRGPKAHGCTSRGESLGWSPGPRKRKFGEISGGPWEERRCRAGVGAPSAVGHPPLGSAPWGTLMSQPRGCPWTCLPAGRKPVNVAQEEGRRRQVFTAEWAGRRPQDTWLPCACGVPGRWLPGLGAGWGRPAARTAT